MLCVCESVDMANCVPTECRDNEQTPCVCESVGMDHFKKLEYSQRFRWKEK